MENQKLVALTFDDGPSNVTEKVLDILEAEGIVGTFFLIGELITPEKTHLLKRQVAMGCEIANHSFTHSDMTKFTPEVIREEIKKTSDVIREVVGVETKFFRPPYILVNDDMYDNIDMPFICGADSRDWDATTTAEDRINNVMNGLRDGAMFLMHDLENNDETVKALPVIIKNLKEQGYGFATVSQIFEAKGVEPKAMEHKKLWSYVLD